MSAMAAEETTELQLMPRVQRDLPSTMCEQGIVGRPALCKTRK